MKLGQKMYFNDGWHFGVIFLTCISACSNHVKTWTSVYKQRAPQPEQPWHRTMQTLEGHGHFNVETSTHEHKQNTLPFFMQHYETPLQPLVYPIFLICFRMTQVHLQSALKQSSVSEQGKRALQKARAIPLPPAIRTLPAWVNARPSPTGTEPRFQHYRAVLSKFYHPHSVPKGASWGSKKTSSSHARRTRGKKKKGVNVTQFGSCK